MRTFITLPLLAMALAGCQVTKDEANDTVTAEFNGDVAENSLSEAANFTENVARDVGNDIDRAAEKIENTDVDLDVDTNTAN